MEATKQNEIRFTDIKGFMLYVGLGRNQALALANRIGCRRRGLAQCLEKKRRSC